MTIQRLYELTDELVSTAEMLRDEFGNTGDLAQLAKDADNLGAGAYRLAGTANGIISAIAGDRALPGAF